MLYRFFLLDIYFKTLKMNKILYLSLIGILLTCTVRAQVGIGTTSPEAGLDVVSSSSGVLIPRVTLSSNTDATTVTIPGSSGIAVSTMVYNDGAGGLSPAGFYYWSGTNWLQLINPPEKQVYVGKFIISSTGSQSITGLPFKPKRIEFVAYANVDSYNLNADNGSYNNNNTKEGYFGFMAGYADQSGGAVVQQIIQGGGSSNSINDVSRYASHSHCIGIRYANKIADKLGLTTASLTSFNSDGFTFNVDNYTDAIVVLYTAYRY